MAMAFLVLILSALSAAYTPAGRYGFLTKLSAMPAPKLSARPRLLGQVSPSSTSYVASHASPLGLALRAHPGSGDVRSDSVEDLVPKRNQGAAKYAAAPARAPSSLSGYVLPVGHLVARATHAPRLRPVRERLARGMPLPTRGCPRAVGAVPF